MFKLVAINTKESVDLSADAKLIGRDPDCDIVLRSGYPSRRHAKIYIKADQVVVEDLGSTNGTFVNNRKIESTAMLQAGDVVRFDSEAYYLSCEDSEDVTLMGSHLEGGTEANASFVVVIDEDEASDDTAFRQSFPPVSGWSSPDDANDRLGKYSEYSSQVIDQLISDGLESHEDVAAALVVLTGEHKKRVVGLRQVQDRQNWNIGRGKDCTIQLDDVSVSSSHAALMYNNGEWVVKDNDSRNGSRINGESVRSGRLQDGDILGFGNVDLVFRNKN